MKVCLRPYQAKIIEDVLSAINQGCTKILVVLAASGGKTLTYSGLIKELNPTHTLISVPTTDLKSQVLKELSDITTPITVMTASAIYSGDSIDCDLFVWDEVHHICSTCLGIEGLKKTSYKYLVGFTATPYRADHRPLLKENGGPFEAVVMGPSIEYLEQNEWIANLEYFAYDMIEQKEIIPVYSYGQVVGHRTKTKFVVDNREQKIVEEYLRFFPNHPKAFVFCRNIKQSMEVADKFNAAGISATYTNCHLSKTERTQRLRDFNDGDVKILTSVNIAAEGINVPSAKVAILSRPISLSLTLFCQQTWRTTRFYKGETAKILDLVGNVWKPQLGLPNDVYKNKEIR